MANEQSAERIGTVLDGQYRLDRLLGEGGVGAVYAAWHINLTRQVAVKLLHAQFAAHGESLERFQREARILSGLGHASFVTVYDFGHAADGTAYLVMEMIEGKTLRHRLQQGQLVSPAELPALFRPLCEAMDQAHQRSILHRDLKPDNLMVLPSGGVKILDFGMAKLMSEAKHLTSAKVVMGTPNYLAPERARGQTNADARSDLFALGAILYEVLSGRFAFYGKTPMDTMLKVISAPIAKLELADSALAKRLDEVIATACAKDPRDRYGTAMELWKAIDQALKEPVVGEEPQKKSSDGLRIKAAVVQGTLAYVNQRFGAAGYQRLCQRLGGVLIEKITSALPIAWMDLEDLHEVHRGTLELFDDGSLQLMRDLGRAFADLALTTTYKSFLTSAGPLTLTRRAQMMYSAMSALGTMRVIQLNESEWSLEIGEVQTISHALMAATVGWVQRYLELAGATEVKFSPERIISTGGCPVGQTTFSFSI